MHQDVSCLSVVMGDMLWLPLQTLSDSLTVTVRILFAPQPDIEEQSATTTVLLLLYTKTAYAG